MTKSDSPAVDDETRQAIEQLGQSLDQLEAMDDDEIAELAALAETLGEDDTAETLRRTFLKGAGAVAAGALTGAAGFAAGTDRASAGTDQVGTIGTANDPVDIEAEDINSEAQTVNVTGDNEDKITFSPDGDDYDFTSGLIETDDADVGPFSLFAKNDVLDNNVLNHTLSFGYNADSDGTQIDGSEPTIRETIEANYEDPNGNFFMEHHSPQGLLADGTSWRADTSKISKDDSKPSTRRLGYSKVLFKDDIVPGNADNAVDFDFDADQIRWFNPLTHQFFSNNGQRWDFSAASGGRLQLSAGGSGTAEFQIWPADSKDELDLKPQDWNTKGNWTKTHRNSRLDWSSGGSGGVEMRLEPIDQGNALRLDVPINYSNSANFSDNNDGMTADPESDVESGFINVKLGGTTKQIPVYDP